MSQDVKLPILTGAGNLEQYIRTVNSIPLLSAEEEHSWQKNFLKKVI